MEIIDLNVVVTPEMYSVTILGNKIITYTQNLLLKELVDCDDEIINNHNEYSIHIELYDDIGKNIVNVNGERVMEAMSKEEILLIPLKELIDLYHENY